MFDSESLLADLPAPRDDEPPSLRSDIVDELADHLACAFRREVLKDGDETLAEQRVIDRFGDPRNLARRLWWQAMWSRIMGQRILSGLQWLVTLAALIAAGVVLWQQSTLLTEINAQRVADSQWRQSLSTTLNDLRSRLPAPGAEAEGGMVERRGFESMGPGGGDAPMPGMMPGMLGGAMGGAMPGATQESPTLTVILKEEGSESDKQEDTDGVNRIRNAEVTLSGHGQIIAGSNQAVDTELKPGISLSVKTNRYLFHSLEPDRYTLKITLPDGQTTRQSVVLRDESRRELTVVCPGPRKTGSLVLTGPLLPDDLIEASYRFAVSCAPAAVVIGDSKWFPSRWQRTTAYFDPKTGELVRLKQMDYPAAEGDTEKVINLTNVRDEDRVILLPTGPEELTFEVVPEGAIQYPPNYVVQLKSVEERIDIAQERISARFNCRRTSCPPREAISRQRKLTSNSVAGGRSAAECRGVHRPRKPPSPNSSATSAG